MKSGYVRSQVEEHVGREVGAEDEEAERIQVRDVLQDVGRRGTPRGSPGTSGVMEMNTVPTGAGRRELSRGTLKETGGAAMSESEGTSRTKTGDELTMCNHVRSGGVNELALAFLDAARMRARCNDGTTRWMTITPGD